MKLELTITLGELLQILAFLTAVFGAYLKLNTSITELKTELCIIKEWWMSQIKEHGTARDYQNFSGSPKKNHSGD